MKFAACLAPLSIGNTRSVLYKSYYVPYTLYISYKLYIMRKYNLPQIQVPFLFFVVSKTKSPNNCYVWDKKSEKTYKNQQLSSEEDIQNPTIVCFSCIYIYIHICLYVYTLIWKAQYVPVYIYIYIYIYITMNMIRNKTKVTRQLLVIDQVQVNPINCTWTMYNPIETYSNLQYVKPARANWPHLHNTDKVLVEVVELYDFHI
jgi:hypothetical protein